MKGQPDKLHSGFSCCQIPDPRGSELLPAQGPCFTPCAGCPVHHLHPLSPALLQPLLQPPGCQRYEPTIPRLRCLHLILPWACCPFLSWTPKEMCFDFHMCKQRKCEGGGISWGNLTINRQELVDKCSFFPALGQLILVGWPSCPGCPSTFLVFTLRVPHGRNPLILKGIRQDSSWGSSGGQVPGAQSSVTHLDCLSLPTSMQALSQALLSIGVWMDFPGGSDGKASVYQCRGPGFDPWVGKIPWRRKWQPTPVLLPGKSHGRRSLVQATVHGVAKSQTRLSDVTLSFPV